MFNRGDKVWHASFKRILKRVVCPECFGKKYLTVILGDDSRVIIDCAGCSAGYDPPKGYVEYFEHSADVELVTICEVRIYNSIEYGFNHQESLDFTVHRIANDKNMFATKPEAEVRAQKLAEEWNQEQLAKIHQKKNNDRSWSWHVHYYRKMIRDAEQTIEDARVRLDVAREEEKEGNSCETS